MLMSGAILVLTLSSADISTPPASLDLLLGCAGIGSRVQPETTTGQVSGSQGYATGSTTTYRKTKSEEQMIVDLSPQGGKLRLPRSLVPPINSGGSDGWWVLNELTITDDAISGRFRLNPLNKPTVRIDRRTGAIELSGYGMGFSGTCEKLERTERKF